MSWISASRASGNCTLGLLPGSVAILTLRFNRNSSRSGRREPDSMSSLYMLLSLGEALVLVVMLIALLRLFGRVRPLGHGSDGNVMQMRDLVLEAQSLSTMLASQLASQAKQAEQTPAARK